MGMDLVQFYKTRVKREWKLAFFAAFVSCLLVHIYKFTNTLPNHDALYNSYSDQNVLGSGRWFLSIACGISSYYDLPWINGLLSAAWMGLTMVVITELFDLHNPILILLSGVLLAAFPSATETMFFEYTADGYFLAMLLSALTAYFLCAGGGHLSTNILAGVTLCLSCAIYQAYVSFAMMLSVCWLIWSIMERRMEKKECARWLIRHIVVYGAAMASYYVIWKLLMAAAHIQANDYQGINTAGQIGLGMLLNGAISAVKNVALFFLEWNILEHPVTLYGALNIVFLLCFAGVMVLAVVKSGVYRKLWKIIMVAIGLIACIPIASIWSFVSDGVNYRPMMMYSFYVLYLLAAILFDRWANKKISTAFGLLLAVMAFNFAIMANIGYYYMDKCCKQSYSSATCMMDRIENEIGENETIDGIAIIGIANTGLGEGESAKIHILAQLLESNLLYDGDRTYLFLKDKLGMNIPKADYERRCELENLQEVQDMGIWPEKDAVQVIDTTLVIKIGEIEQQTP